ncbi:MAG: SDR family oxidoreductase [Cytophagales bacterium]|nr:SDR family oxidoreductase [Cytophagales bacterium]
MEKKKILVTGSNGLLGQKLVRLIVQENEYDLVATARGENRLLMTEGYQFCSMDVTNEEEVAKVIAEEKPNYVIHTAAMTNVDQCEDEQEGCDKLNVDAVAYLVKACEENNVFFVHLSTDFIFDGETGPYKEEDEPNPISYYGESKLRAENIVTESSIKWAIARTVLVYGITEGMSRSNIVLWVKKSIEEEKQLQIVNDQLRSPTLAEDLAMGCYLIVKKEAEGVYNISGKDVLTPYEMAIKTADYFNLDKSFINETDGSKFQQRAKRPPKTGFIIDKAVKDLDYNPHSFEEGIAILEKQVKEFEAQS